MIFIKTTPESNSAHESLITSDVFTVPECFAVVRDDLEQKALSLLPWVKLTVTDGVITAVEDDTEARKAWEALPEVAPPLDPVTQTQLAVAELAEAAAQRDIENKLAIAELAEIVAGGK